MKTAIVIAGILCSIIMVARAQNVDAPNLAQVVIRDSATIVDVQASSYTFVQVDTPVLRGSNYVLIESTNTAGFCVAFTVNASTVAGASNPCMRARYEPTSARWWFEIRRWWQNLPIYAQSFSTTGTTELRILQGR